MIWVFILNLVVTLFNNLLDFFPSIDPNVSNVITSGITQINGAFTTLRYFIATDTLSIIINMIVGLELAYLGLKGIWLLLRQTKLVSK